jgi:FSR family fosmidomycin resistance protein-like MFS transporter
MKPASMLPLLFFLAATHLVVDLVAGTLNPLWPRFNAHYRLGDWEAVLLFFIWQTSASVSQFVFGLYGDRFNTRWLLWTGPIIATLCISSVGLFQSPLVLGLLLAASGLGIAAFHPEGAALAGSCVPEHRSRAMSIFTVGGFIGQAIGPAYSGAMVDWLGLRGLAWGILGGLLAAAFLFPLGRGVMAQPARSAAPPVDLRTLFRGREGPLLLVLVIGSLRIIAAAGVPVLIGYLLAAREASATETGIVQSTFTGIVQSAFMFGIGLGSLASATLFKPRHERAILWLCPLLVTPVLLVIPIVDIWWLLMGSVGLSGLLLGISLPVLISYGQQLMPDSQRIASSITMGVSWGIGGGIVSLILYLCQRQGHFEPAFPAFAVATLASSVLCIWLPTLSQAQPAAPRQSLALEPPGSAEPQHTV